MTPEATLDAGQTTWFMACLWTGLGLVGAGISVSVRISRGEKVNPWAVGATLAAGMGAAGTCTQALVSFANISPGWSGGVALLLGLMAMGFVTNALDGKIPFINKFMGESNASGG